MSIVYYNEAWLLWNGNTAITLTLFIITTFLIPVLYLLIKKKDASFTYPPYAPYGHIQTLKMIFNGESVSFAVQAAEQVGPVFRCRLFPGPMVVVLSDLNAVRAVLNDKRSTKTPSMYSMLSKVHGGDHDMFVSEGPYWVHSRKGMSPAFSTHHIRRMNRVVLEKTNQYMKNKLNFLAETRTPFDIGIEMLHLTLSIISESSFEYNMGMEERELILLELDIFFKGLGNMNPFRALFARIITNPAVERISLATDRLVNVARNILKNYRSLESPVEGTAIDLIVKNKNYKDDKERIGDIIVIIVGGHDTTAYSLAWTLLELAKNQSELQKLRSELQKVSPEDRHTTKQLHFVVKEGLRLHPVAGSMGPCRTIADDVIVKRDSAEPDIMIPKGSSVFCSAYLLFRSKAYYEDPTDFKPSRWQNPSENAKNAFIPFFVGRRNCVGQSLATSTLHTVMARLCVHYDFTVVEQGRGVAFFTYKPEKVILLATRTAA